MRKIMWTATAIFVASIVASNAAEFKRQTEMGYDLTYVCRGQDIFTIAGQQVQRQVCGWRHQALEMPPGVYGSYWLGPLPQGPTYGPYCPPGFDCSYDIGASRTRVTIAPHGQYIPRPQVGVVDDGKGWYFNNENIDETIEQMHRAFDNRKAAQPPSKPYKPMTKDQYDVLWKQFKEANP